MQCQYIKQDKVQCNAHAMTGTQYCFTHNPASQADKRAAVQNGGRAPKPRKEAKPLAPLSVKSVAEVIALMEDTINRTRTEPFTHQKANSVGYLANVSLKALEAGELEARVEALEQQIAQTGRNR